MLRSPTVSPKARTGTLEAPRKSKAGKIAAVVLVTGISGAATFAIVSATRGSKADKDGSNVAANTPSGSDAGAQPAGNPPTPDAAVDAPPDAPPDAPAPVAPPPVDAGVPDAPKKDANPTPQVQAGSKKLGTLTVHAFPVVTVYLDGKRLRDTPINQFAVPVGKHTVRLKNTDSAVDEKISITITEGKDTPIDRVKQ